MSRVPEIHREKFSPYTPCRGHAPRLSTMTRARAEFHFAFHSRKTEYGLVTRPPLLSHRYFGLSRPHELE